MLQKPINQPSQQPKIIEDEAKKRQRGTGFTNISKVLGANVGAGQKMGQAIGGQLGQQAEQVRKGIEQGQAKFQAGLQKEQQKRQETVGAITGAIGDIQKNLGQAPKDFYSIPENDTSSPNLEYADIGQNLRNLEYLGPKSIENIQEQQQKAANLAALGRLSGMVGGQQQLLRSQIAGRGRYGLGQSSLDALLLGKEGQRELQAARSETGGVETQAQQAEKMAEAEAQTAQNSTENAKIAAIQKLQQETQGLLNLGSEQAQQYYTTGKYAQDALRKISEAKDPTSVQLSEEEKQALTQAKNLGLDLNTRIDTRNQDLVNEMIKRMGSAGSNVYGGGQILSPAQKIALRNLDLLQQGKEINRKEAERDLFGDVSKQTDQLLNEEYENKLKRENLKRVYDREEAKKTLLSTFNHRMREDTPDSYIGGTLNYWMRHLDDPNWARVTPSGERYPLTQHERSGLNSYINEMERREKEYQSQNKATVQDYIDKILGKK